MNFSPRDYWLNVAQPKAREALHTLRMTPSKPNQTANFATLFKAKWTPSSAQAHCGELELPAGPMLVFIEDVTGAGKTESALLLAQRMMVAGKGRGLFVALPTTATANAMYERMADAIDVFSLQTPNPPSLSRTGAAGCMKDFVPRSCQQERGGRAPFEVRSKPSRRPASAFFADDRRKALLADVGVGTIDQALLGVLPTKYATLRQLGLASKNSHRRRGARL